MKTVRKVDLNVPLQPSCVYVIQALFNRDVTDLLAEGAVHALQEVGDPGIDIHWICVPGAVEIPLIAQQIAAQGLAQAIVAVGAVICGETDHYRYVCEQVSQGCQQVMLQYNIPVAFGVLTTQNMAQALDRAGGTHGNKGYEASQAALKMVALLQHLEHKGSDHDA